MYSGIDIKYQGRFWTDDRCRPGFINWWQGGEIGGIGSRCGRMEEYKEGSGNKEDFFCNNKKSNKISTFEHRLSGCHTCAITCYTCCDATTLTKVPVMFSKQVHCIDFYQHQKSYFIITLFCLKICCYKKKVEHYDYREFFNLN